MRMSDLGFKRKAKERGVKVTGLPDFCYVQCLKCGALWEAVPYGNGELPRGWWMCPNKCNWYPPYR